LIDKMVYSHRGMPATDVHQHLWPEPLLGLLAARLEVPRLRRHARGWELELAGEPPSVIDLRAHDPAARAEVARADGVERVLVAPSAPLGIESLPDAQPLLDAFHDGVRALGEPFAAWGAIALAAPDPADVDALMAAGAAGLCLPASALGDPRALDHVGPILERLAAHRAPLLVHPGPAPASDRALPAWWPAMTSYVAEMQTAWLAWAAWGRAAHPELKVVWAMLAGGAPLHAERLAARGGPAGAVLDDRAWFDVSSYGPKAVDAMLRVVGVDRLVLGTDRPVADPPSLAALGPAVRHALAHVNPSTVLDRA
jgi:6-methylsalicylate decarboxylase